MRVSQQQRSAIRRADSTSSAPVYDIADHYKPEDTQDMLVRNNQLGGALAGYFGDGPQETSVVLM